MKVFFILMALIAGSPALAQVDEQNMPTPQGTFFTESFGDTGIQPCGYGAPWNHGLYSYSGCNAIWGSSTFGSGGSISIANSSGCTGNGVFPAGPKSLEVTTGSGNTYVSSAGFTPTLGTSTTWTLQFALCVASSSLPAYDAQSLFSEYAGGATNNIPCEIGWHSTSSGTIDIRGNGSTTSSDSAKLSLDTWYTVKLVCVPGGTSTLYLNGTGQTFTANSYGWNVQTWGGLSGNLVSINYFVGYETIYTNVQSSGAGPNWYNNFEDSSNGTQLTPAILAASTIGGNGSYTCSNGGYETISTSAQESLLNPLDAFGAQYTDSGSTRGYQFLYSGTTAAACTYAFVSFSPVAGEFEWAVQGLPTSDATSYTSMDLFNNSNGSDFVSHMTHNGQLYLETNKNPNGANDISLCTNAASCSGTFFNYVAGTKYGIATQYQEYSAGSVAGAVYLVEGSVVAGTFTAGETLTQSTSGATAILLISPNGQNAMQIRMMSGAVTSTNTWTGASSGATFTPTTLPTTFHTFLIYNSSCQLLSTQLKIAQSTTPTIPGGWEIGRGGDTNASNISTSWYADNMILNYATGAMPICQ